MRQLHNSARNRTTTLPSRTLHNPLQKQTHTKAATHTRLQSKVMRVSFNGRTLASQANNVGSIPITRSKQKSPLALASGLLLEMPEHLNGSLLHQQHWLLARGHDALRHRAHQHVNQAAAAF